MKNLIQVKENILNLEESRMNSFLDIYFNSLNIPIDDESFIPEKRPNYKRFACQLIRISDKYKIAISSIMSSKCAGAIYILSLKRKELKIKKEMIENKCEISKSTFNRFYKEINKILQPDSTHIAKPELEDLFKILQ